MCVCVCVCVYVYIRLKMFVFETANNSYLMTYNCKVFV